MFKIYLCLVFIVLAQIVSAQSVPLDATFNSNGIVITNVGGYDAQPNEALLQPDGKIIVAGTAYYYPYNVNSNFFIVRYNTDGSPDNFGNNGGQEIINVADPNPANQYDLAYGVALQADGKIVVAGQTSGYIGSTPIGDVNPQFAVMRFNTDGSIDSSFATNGVFMGRPAGLPTVRSYICGLGAVAIGADQKIVLAGYYNPGTVAVATLMRLNTDGSVDETFGNNGYSYFAPDSDYELVYSLLIQQDQKIIIAGNETSKSANDGYFLARYDTTGNLDISFGTNGVVLGGSSSGALTGIALQSDQKIVSSIDGSLGAGFSASRFNTNGSLDQSFGNAGATTVQFQGGGTAFSVAVKPDGKIALTGITPNHFATAELDANGNLDSAFGLQGVADTAIEGDDCDGYLVLAQPDEKIVVIGTVLSENYIDLGLIRYNADSLTSGISQTNGPIINGAVYPNPFNGMVSVKIDLQTAGDVEYTVTDVLGRELFRQKESCTPGTFTRDLNLGSLAEGCYFLNVAAGNAKWITKIFRQ